LECFVQTTPALLAQVLEAGVQLFDLRLTQNDLFTEWRLLFDEFVSTWSEIFDLLRVLVDFGLKTLVFLDLKSGVIELNKSGVITWFWVENSSLPRSSCIMYNSRSESQASASLQSYKYWWAFSLSAKRCLRASRASRSSAHLA
jgi:hypothetical protein